MRAMQILLCLSRQVQHHAHALLETRSDRRTVSCIVPLCTHVDQTEHDLDVIVTEQGLADVRGVSPRERARVVIKECAHPDYKPILTEDMDKAEWECLRRGWGHEPHLLWQAFDMHRSLQENGSMKVTGWK